MQDGQRVRFLMVSTGINPALARRISRGEYVVDEHAVAEAIVRCWRRDSLVLVAAQSLDRAAVRADEEQLPAGNDRA
jgi:hypothetical protein